MPIGLLVPALFVLQQAPLAELRGRVTSRTDVPLPGVELTVLRDSTSVTTDADGRFVLRARPGELVIRVRRIGYLPQYLSASLRAGERREVTVAMTSGTYQLPDVEVNAMGFKPIEYAYTMKYDEFFRRKHIGLGHYLTRRDIDRKTASETSSLLMGLPGVIVIPGAPGIRATAIRVPGCDKIGVWVDGAEIGVGRNEPGIRPSSIGASGGKNPGVLTGELLETILPLQIEFIEVYTGPSRMPAETIGNSCAAIMIWTR